MTNAAVNINNISTSYISLDFGLNGTDKIVRRTLSPIGSVSGTSVDVGDLFTYEELNTIPQIRQLLDAVGGAKISVTTTPGTSDLSGAIVTLDALLVGPEYTFTFPYTAGAGAADDVTLFNANFPFAAKMIDAQLMVSTAAGAGGRSQVRSAAAGAGSAYSDLFVADALGRKRDAGVGNAGVVPVLARNDSLFLRRTVDSSLGVGHLILTFARIS